jgi:N-methylhydantoinase A
MYRYRVDEPVELANLRCIAVGHRPERLDFANASTATAGGDGQTSRPVRFEGSDAEIEVPVLARPSVGPDWRSGPLIIETYDTTIVAPPGSRVRSDGLGNLIMELER